MQKLIFSMLILFNLAFCDNGFSYVSNPGKPKMLHMALHLGCIKDIEDVVENLKNVDLTSWYVAGMQPRTDFDGVSNNNSIWCITHERAKAIWERHKDYFEQFDIIFTSDIAPLSRIFLQNGWKKPLIIWICNRFDYYDQSSLDGAFPDRAYYQMFQDAVYAPNVRIIPYTDYEWYYAQHRGVSVSKDTITPLGSIDDSKWFGKASGIPENVDTEETLFIYPRLYDHQMRFAQTKCDELGIACYSGRYNGPGELTRFKAVLYFPYQWSNLALFENLQRGIIHFVPSPAFVANSLRNKDPIRYCTTNLFQFCEWYKAKYKDVIIYFDSWADLKTKFESLDYKEMQERIKAFGKEHRVHVLAQWQAMFDSLIG